MLPHGNPAELWGGEGRQAAEKATDRCTTASEDDWGSGPFTHDRSFSRGVSARRCGGDRDLISKCPE